MSLTEWLQHRFLAAHATSPQEIADLLAITRRDLREASSATHCPEWKLAIAFNAALQAATTALAAAGYRAAKGSGHHHYTLQSLRFTVGLDSETLLMLQTVKRKRDKSDYERAGGVSAQEALDAIALATQVVTRVREWLQAEHPDLM
ncbi:MAG: hypothetical protein AB1778_02005 [Candidatus Bipolaricaulota bacterium]